MAVWTRTTNISEVLRNDALSLEAKGAEVARRLLNRCRGMANYDDLQGLCEELADVGKSGNVAMFDSVLSAIYDWCDTNQVWVAG